MLGTIMTAAFLTMCAYGLVERLTNDFCKSRRRIVWLPLGLTEPAEKPQELPERRAASAVNTDHLSGNRPAA